MIETPHGIFTDLKDEHGNIVKTAEEVYKEWLENKDKQIDICPTKTTEEKLEELIGQVSLIDELIANLTLEVVENE